MDAFIIGAGPIGLTCALEAQRRGLQYIVADKGCVANSIYYYPTNMRFFSSPDLLEIGGVPFITQGEKSTRQETLEYYRRVVVDCGLHVRLYEEVLDVAGQDGDFRIETAKGEYRAAKVIAAIGYFDHPRVLKVPGENLPKVTHYYREAHAYSDQDVLIVGSGNSAVEAALECHRHGARVTLAVRKDNFHEGIKYWIRPDIENRIQSGEIAGHFGATVKEIKPESVLLERKNGETVEVSNDFVLALTGYEPDFEFLKQIGVRIGEDATRPPHHDPQTYESNRRGLYLAGVVVGGLDTKKWFIENSRAHAAPIFEHLTAKLSKKRS